MCSLKHFLSAAIWKSRLHHVLRVGLCARIMTTRKYSLLNPVHIVRSFIICLVSCFVTIYSSVCCLFGKNDLVWCKKILWVADQLHYWLTYIQQLTLSGVFSIFSCGTQFHPFGPSCIQRGRYPLFKWKFIHT